MSGFEGILCLYHPGNSLLNFCCWYNACDSAMLLGRQACGAAGKRCDSSQFIFCQIRRSLIQFQEAAHALPPKISPAPVVSTTWIPAGEAISPVQFRFAK